MSIFKDIHKGILFCGTDGYCKQEYDICYHNRNCKSELKNAINYFHTLRIMEDEDRNPACQENFISNNKNIELCFENFPH